jgi:hypothetical protein
VKIVLTSVLVALGAISLSVNSRAAAQQPMSPAGPLQGAFQQPGLAGPQPVAATNGSRPTPGTPVPAPAPNAPVDTSLLIDNGLWDNAPLPACCGICGGGSCSPPDWYTKQGIRFLARSRPRDLPVAYDETFSTVIVTSGTTSTARNEFDYPELLNDRTGSPNFSAAYSMTIGHYFARDTSNRDHFVEFSFWGLNGYRDEGSANASARDLLRSSPITVPVVKPVGGTLVSPYYYDPKRLVTPDEASLNLTTGSYVFGFDGADSYRTFYSSSTNNFEINGRIRPRNQEDRLVLHPNGKWRRECTPGTYISYLYGMRFLQLNETFGIHGQGQYDFYQIGPNGGLGPLVDTQFHTGDYDVVAHNNLLGLQFGAELEFRQCRWDWGVNAKLGPYVNFADQVSNIHAGPAYSLGDLVTDEFVHRLAASKHVASMIGELEFTAHYKFRPNLVGQASYSFTWMTGMALAPEQLQFDLHPINKINTNGTVLMHGPSLSLEWLW